MSRGGARSQGDTTPDARHGMKRTELLARIAAEEARVSELEAQKAEAQRCLDALRAEVASLPDDGSTGAPPKTTGEKVALFRSLFRGRPEVFPKCWRNVRSGKEGYSPQRRCPEARCTWRRVVLRPAGASQVPRLPAAAAVPSGASPASPTN